MALNDILAKRIYIVSTVLLIIAALWYGKVEQAQSYYLFADDRTFFGIPNGLDVMSNLAIVYPGVIGLMLVYERQKNGHEYRDPIEQTIQYCLFLGMVLTFLGSVWFHLNPNDSTLVWDRLAMTVVMACYCSLIIADRYSIDLAKRIHFPLISIGLLSVIYWEYSGDLRPYFFFKMQPVILVAILLVYGKKTYDRAADYIISMSLVLVATLTENIDKIIFDNLDIISGHTMKHIIAGISLWWIMRMIQKRKLIDSKPALTLR